MPRVRHSAILPRVADAFPPKLQLLCLCEPFDHTKKKGRLLVCVTWQEKKIPLIYWAYGDVPIFFHEVVFIELESSNSSFWFFFDCFGLGEKVLCVSFFFRNSHIPAGATCSAGNVRFSKYSPEALLLCGECDRHFIFPAEHFMHLRGWVTEKLYPMITPLNWISSFVQSTQLFRIISAYPQTIPSLTLPNQKKIMTPADAKVALRGKSSICDIPRRTFCSAGNVKCQKFSPQIQIVLRGTLNVLTFREKDIIKKKKKCQKFKYSILPHIKRALNLALSENIGTTP